METPIGILSFFASILRNSLAGIHCFLIRLLYFLHSYVLPSGKYGYDLSYNTLLLFPVLLPLIYQPTVYSNQ